MIAAVKKLPLTLNSSAATITQSCQLPVSPANAGTQLLARQTVNCEVDILLRCCVHFGQIAGTPLQMPGLSTS